MITSLIKVLKILNSETSPSQIALGIMMGVMVGVGFLSTPHVLLLIFLVIIFKINLSAFLLTYGLFALFSFVLDPFTVAVGERLLTEPSLATFWTSLYQIDFMRLMQFNHTHTLGSLVIAILFSVPIYLLSRWIIIHYRQHILAYVAQLKVVKALKSSAWYQRCAELYQAVEG